MPDTDYVAAASSCNRVSSDCAAGKGSPTSNSVVNSSSNKSSVTTLATSSAISSLSTQLHAMLDGCAGESFRFVKKPCMCVRAVASSFTAKDMKFFSFRILVCLNAFNFLQLINVTVLSHQTFFLCFYPLFFLSQNE